MLEKGVDDGAAAGVLVAHQVAERIVEAAGYRLDPVTPVRFTGHVAPGVRPFWCPIGCGAGSSRSASP